MTGRILHNCLYNFHKILHLFNGENTVFLFQRWVLSNILLLENKKDWGSKSGSIRPLLSQLFTTNCLRARDLFLTVRLWSILNLYRHLLLSSETWFTGWCVLDQWCEPFLWCRAVLSFYNWSKDYKRHKIHFSIFTKDIEFISPFLDDITGRSG